MFNEGGSVDCFSLRDGPLVSWNKGTILQVCGSPSELINRQPAKHFKGFGIPAIRTRLTKLSPEQIHHKQNQKSIFLIKKKFSANQLGVVGGRTWQINSPTHQRQWSSPSRWCSSSQLHLKAFGRKKGSLHIYIIQLGESGWNTLLIFQMFLLTISSNSKMYDLCLGIISNVSGDGRRPCPRRHIRVPRDHPPLLFQFDPLPGFLAHVCHRIFRDRIF